MKVTMYTDGAASGNPGPGGYGTVLLYKTHRKELSEGFRFTTNNRMELMAVIKGLEALTRKQLVIEIFSDSSYVVNTVEKGWLQGWVKNEFKGKKNRDLWEQYLRAAEGQQIIFRWVKGHNGNPENEHCDKLAVRSSRAPHLQVDRGYENGDTQPQS